MFTIKYIKRQLKLLKKFELTHRWTEVDDILYELDFYEDEYNEVVDNAGDWETSEQEIVSKMIIIIGRKGLIIDFNKGIEECYKLWLPESLHID